MKRNLLFVFSFILLIALSSASASAQAEDRRTISAASNLYVVSAKAGGVNFVVGKVVVARKDAKGGLLLKGDELEVGDRIETGADGKAEILLNPGSLVRLGENSNFEFVTTSLDDLQLKLNGGTAMFEVITDAAFGFSVNTPKARFDIIKSGVYRIDVLSDGTGKIEVWKGKANTNNAEIKGGRQATVSGEQTAIIKFDRDDKDALELWSKSRAKELAKVNARLQNSAVRATLMNSFARTRWSLNDSYGLWLYSPMFGSYCFLPFAYGWSSPYGFYYPRDIWHYNLPPVIYNPPVRGSNLPSPNSAADVSDSTPSRSVRRSRIGLEADAMRITPPYRRIQKDIETFPAEAQTDVFPSSTPVAPIRISPSSSAPTAPAQDSVSAPPVPAQDSMSPSPMSRRKGGN